MPQPRGAAARSSPGCDREGKGHASVNYRLRDWLVSRQRYWGCPIPIVYCDALRHGAGARGRAAGRAARRRGLRAARAARRWRPPRTGSTRAARSCGGPARRETDTMDTFVDSSWYFLRYCDAAQRPAPPGTRRRSRVDAGRPVHRRRRARDPAPDVRALLHQGARRPRPPRLPGAVHGAVHAGHDHQGRREDVQVARQRRLARRRSSSATAPTRRAATSSSSARPTRTPTGPTRASRACTASSARLWRLAAEIGRARGDPRPSARIARDGTDGRATSSCCARPTGRSTRSPPTCGRFAFNTAIAAVMELVNDCYRLREAAHSRRCASRSRPPPRCSSRSRRTSAPTSTSC